MNIGNVTTNFARLGCLLFLAADVAAYDFTVLQGAEFGQYRDEFAEIRLNFFRDYPYLYEGTLQCERDYIDHYSASNNSVLFMAKDQGKVVGAISGIPLDEEPECRKAFQKNNLPTHSVYYLGELAVLKDHQGEGIETHLCDLFEQFVRDNGAYSEIAFCEIVPSKEDPRSTNYVGREAFWMKRGFIQHPEITTQMSWKDVGGENEMPHSMVFWAKRL